LKKHLLVEFELSEGQDTDTGAVLLEGDHRQSNQRMLRQLAEWKLGTIVETDEAEGIFESEDRTLSVGRVEGVTRDDLDDVDSSTFTLVVNENVTEPACRVSY